MGSWYGERGAGRELDWNGNGMENGGKQAMNHKDLHVCRRLLFNVRFGEGWVLLSELCELYVRRDFQAQVGLKQALARHGAHLVHPRRSRISQLVRGQHNVVNGRSRWSKQKLGSVYSDSRRKALRAD